MSVKQTILYPFAKRFFAGVTLEDAVARAQAVNALGMGATLDFLGEDLKDKSQVRVAMSEYARAIGAISEAGLDASLALKLTHIGLLIDRKMAEENALALAGLAAGRGVFLWIDMEGAAYTDDIIWAYRRLLETYEYAGVALQAYLKRTWRDLRALVEADAKVRLVKGAYNEPPEIAIQGMAEIRARFEAMMEYLFSEAPHFAVGTHDRGLIQKALKLSGGYRGEFEFQMLMGMRDDLKRGLAQKGRRVVEYVPYGSEWYGYGTRRLMEKRRNILYFAQGLFGR